MSKKKSTKKKHTNYCYASDLVYFTTARIQEYEAAEKEIEKSKETLEYDLENIKATRAKILRYLIDLHTKAVFSPDEKLPHKIKTFSRLMREQHADMDFFASNKATGLETALQRYNDLTLKRKHLRAKIRTIFKTPTEHLKTEDKIGALEQKISAQINRAHIWKERINKHPFKAIYALQHSYTVRIVDKEETITTALIKQHYFSGKRTKARKAFIKQANAFLAAAREKTGFSTLSMNDLCLYLDEFETLHNKESTVRSHIRALEKDLETERNKIRTIENIRYDLKKLEDDILLEQLSTEAAKVLTNEKPFSQMHAQLLINSPYEDVVKICQSQLDLVDQLKKYLTHIQKTIQTTKSRLDNVQETFRYARRYDLLDTDKEYDLDETYALSKNVPIATRMVLFITEKIIKSLDNIPSIILTFDDLYDTFPKYHVALDLLQKQTTQNSPSAALLQETLGPLEKWRDVDIKWRKIFDGICSLALCYQAYMDTSPLVREKQNDEHKKEMEDARRRHQRRMRMMMYY